MQKIRVIPFVVALAVQGFCAFFVNQGLLSGLLAGSSCFVAAPYCWRWGRSANLTAVAFVFKALALIIAILGAANIVLVVT